MILDELRSRHLGDDRDLQLAVGNLDLNSLERIDDFDPDKQVRENHHSKSPPRHRKHCCGTFQCERSEFQNFQMPAASSRHWSDVVSAGGSVWSRDFRPACRSESKLSDAASPRRPSRSSEEERVTSRRIPCGELQVKRPREGTLAEWVIQRQDIRVVGGGEPSRHTENMERTQ